MTLTDRIKAIFSRSVPRQKTVQREPSDLESQLKMFPELNEVYSDILLDRYDKVEQLVQSADEGEPEGYSLLKKKLVILADFRRKDYSKLALCREVAEKTGAGTDWFNLARAAVMTSDFSQGQAAFNNVEKAYKSGNYGENISFLLLRYYFAQFLRECGEYEKAFEQVNELRSVYEELRITDDTFVYIRGVPMLAHTMDLAMSLFPHLAGKVDPVVWIDSFSKKLDDEGKLYLLGCKNKLN